MVDEYFIELMNRSVDERLSAEEQAELDRYLSAHPEAREYYKNLNRAVQAVTQIPTVDPPARLKRNIMDTVQSVRATTGRGQGILGAVRAMFGRRIVWRYAYAFSAGVICGFAVLAVVLQSPQSSRPLDPSQASGALVLADKADDLLPIDRAEFAVGSAAGTIQTKLSNGLILLQIDIASVDEAMIEIFFDTADLSFAGFWQPDHFRGNIDRIDSLVSLRHPGAGKHFLVFTDRTPAVSNLVLEIMSGSKSDREVLSTGSADH